MDPRELKRGHAQLIDEVRALITEGSRVRAWLPDADQALDKDRVLPMSLVLLHHLVLALEQCPRVSCGYCFVMDKEERARDQVQ